MRKLFFILILFSPSIASAITNTLVIFDTPGAHSYVSTYTGQVTVEIWGAGGGGEYIEGGGGGGGCYARSSKYLQSGQTYTMNIGAGGSGAGESSNVSGGGATTFGDMIAGGGGPSANEGGNGGAPESNGCTTASGDFISYGGNGSIGNGNGPGIGGAGGAGGCADGGGHPNAFYENFYLYDNGCAPYWPTLYNPSDVCTVVGGYCLDHSGGSGGEGGFNTCVWGEDGQSPGGGGGGGSDVSNCNYYSSDAVGGGAGAPGRVKIFYTIPDKISNFGHNGKISGLGYGGKIVLH